MTRIVHTTLFFTSVLWALLITACGGAPVEVASSTTPLTTTTQPTTTTAPSATSGATAESRPTTTLVPTAAAATATQTATATVDPTATTAATAETVAAAINTITPTPTVRVAAAGGAAVRNDISGRIAFVRGGSIYVYTPQNGTIAMLIEDGRDMQFSRDGTQIAFVRDDGLYLASADGSNQRRIANQPSVQAPRWTDDGSKLVFERVVDPTNIGSGEIWTIELPNGSPVRITTGADPAWAPDGKRLTYVTAPTGELRRNQLRLTNWQGLRDWGPVKDLPDNTPAIGIPGNQVPPAGLEHLMFSPVWDAEGQFIYVPSFVLMQVETDFTILERADSVNGDSVFVSEIQAGVLNGIGSPDRRAIAFTAGSARGDIKLFAYPIDPTIDGGELSWAETREVALHEAPSWAPTSDAIAFFRCSLEDPNRCDLALLKPGLEQPDVLVPNVFGDEGPDRSTGLFTAWGS